MLPSLTLFCSPPTPFITGNVFHSIPCTVSIIGSIKQFTSQTGEDFASINLSNGDDFPRMCTPFHLSIRPGQRLLVRNVYSSSEGYGTSERKTTEGFNWTFNGEFSLIIHLRLKQITGIIDGMQAFTFQHRYPPECINLLQINGNIQLKKIKIEFD